MSSINNEDTDLGKKVFLSASWLVAGNWVSRLLGIVSTIILARILYPDDYGVVAKGMLLVSFVETVATVDGSRYLIRKPKVDDDDFHTAWTLCVLQFSIIALFLFLSAGLFSKFFHEPRLEDVVIVLAIGVLVTGFQNIGLEKYKRNLQFSKIFIFLMKQRFIGFFVTVAAALILQTYWAMIIGTVVFRVAGVVLSYFAHSFRPHFTLKKVKLQWSFTKWILVNNLASFFRNKVDQVIVSRYFDSSSMGLYSMGHQLSGMVSNELVAPIYQALYPGYAKLQHDFKGLAKAHINALGALSTIIFPLAFGLTILCNDFVVLLLGARWIETVPLIQTLVLVAAAMSINGASSNLLIALDKVRQVTIIDWLYVLILIPVLIYTGNISSMIAVAWARLLITVFVMPVYLSMAHNILPISWGQSLGALWRPVVAASIMVAVIWSNPLYNKEVGVLSFMAQIILGGVVYLSVLYGLWIISGRHYTGEKLLYDKLIGSLKR